MIKKYLFKTIKRYYFTCLRPSIPTSLPGFLYTGPVAIGHLTRVTALKSYEKWALTPCKLRVFVRFCLVTRLLQAHTRKQSGFFMLEAVIAILLLGLIAGSFFMPLTVILRSTHDMQYHLKAYLMANATMEKELAYWRQYGLSALKLQVSTQAQFTCYPCHPRYNTTPVDHTHPPPYTLSTTLLPYPDSPGLYQLSIHVTGKGDACMTTLIGEK